MNQNRLKTEGPLVNPDGIPSQSPGLRGTSYPGFAVRKAFNPNGVASFGSPRYDATPLGLFHSFSDFTPRVVASLQPWAECLSPFGANQIPTTHNL
jgi:hypothetical protein